MEWKILLYARRKEPLDIPDDLSKYPMNDFELTTGGLSTARPSAVSRTRPRCFPWTRVTLCAPG